MNAQTNHDFISCLATSLVICYLPVFDHFESPKERKIVAGCGEAKAEEWKLDRARARLLAAQEAEA